MVRNQLNCLKPTVSEVRLVQNQLNHLKADIAGGWVGLEPTELSEPYVFEGMWDQNQLNCRKPNVSEVRLVRNQLNRVSPMFLRVGWFATN